MMVERILEARTEKEAYDYYSYVYENGLFTKEQLRKSYEDAESHKKEWEEHSVKGRYEYRDYISYVNSLNALKKLLEEINE